MVGWWRKGASGVEDRMWRSTALRAQSCVTAVQQPYTHVRVHAAHLLHVLAELLVGQRDAGHYLHLPLLQRSGRLWPRSFRPVGKRARTRSCSCAAASPPK